MALTDNILERGGRTDLGSNPPLPLWIVIIRVFQLILAILILALTAFAASVFKYTYSGFAMAWFTFIWTLGYLIYLGVSAFAVPAIYNVWIQLGLEIATNLWWLVTWALLASEASLWAWYDQSYTYVDQFGNVQTVNDYLPSNWSSAINCAKASAGLGALEWVLFIITLVMLGLYIHGYRQENNSANPPSAITAAGPVMEEHKLQNVNVQQQRYPEQQYPQQQYPQQQYPQQQYQQQ